MKRIACVIMHPSLGTSPGERLVQQGREASTFDLVGTLARAGIERIVLFTPSATFADRLADRATSCNIRLISTEDESRFHFGRAIKQVIAEGSLDGLIYFGSGAGGLLTAEQMKTLLEFASRSEPGGLFNNFYSCDFCAIAGAERLLAIDLPEIDNPVGFCLADSGIRCFSLPREAATQFDIDTPTDLCLLTATEHGGAAMRAFLATKLRPYPRLGELLDLLADRTARLTLIGRVNPLTWAHLEGQIACRTSVYSEGRGMRSYPDERNPRRVPLLAATFAATIAATGSGPFFERLVCTTDAVVIDTRPLLSAAGPFPQAADRFRSDLLQPESITDPLWKEFTRAAAGAKIPVILGGHSLVNGGLYLMAEACWKDRSLRRRLHPDRIDFEALRRFK